MPSEAPPNPHPSLVESLRSGLVARAADAEVEEAANAAGATRDWTIAPTPIPPDITRRRTGRPLAARQEPAHHPGLQRRRRGLPALHRQAAARDLPLGSPALRGQPRRRPGHPWPPAQNAQIATVVRDSDGVLALQRRRRDQRPGPPAETRRADPERTPSLRVARGGRRSAARHALIQLLYNGDNGGLRVSELVTLRWRNLVEGVANVTGKGRTTRVLPALPVTLATSLRAVGIRSQTQRDTSAKYSGRLAWRHTARDPQIYTGCLVSRHDSGIRRPRCCRSSRCLHHCMQWRQ
jgi:integrase